MPAPDAGCRCRRCWTPAVWAASDADVWAAGDLGTMVHYYSGGGWSLQSPPPTDVHIQAVYAFAKDDVWAAAESVRLVHFDGHTWTPVPSPTGQGLKGLWGSSPTDIWAVGKAGTILHRGP